MSTTTHNSIEHSNNTDPTQAPTVTSTKNINQAETVTKNAQVADDKFINIFYTLVQDRGNPSSRHVDLSNMHTFYQRHPSELPWTKDHPLEQVIRNPSQSVRTRRQLESDGEMYLRSIHNFIKMSNTNNTMQTQTSNALYNAIMEVGGKDRPPMLAPGSTETTTERYMENYKNVSQDIRDQLNAKAEAVQIILTGIDNDIYSIVDACPNASEIANQYNSSRINKGTGYENQKIVDVAGARENVEQADWRHDTDDEPDDQEFEVHYMYMAQLQEVTPDATNNSGPIFDSEPFQKDDDDDDDDLANERDFLASLIEKLKCEIDDSKNRNKFLETSNKALVDKLKGEIADIKTKNK
nr:hypothetical protein [Tanacetum cinerariifolium]